jgi:hypothetical protein
MFLCRGAAAQDCFQFWVDRSFVTAEYKHRDFRSRKLEESFHTSYENNGRVKKTIAQWKSWKSKENTQYF